MYFIIYSYNILCLLARMLFGLALSERKTAELLKNIESKFNGNFRQLLLKKLKSFKVFSNILSMIVLQNSKTGLLILKKGKTINCISY